MAAQLTPLKPGSGPIIVIQRPVVLVGRHPDCDVRVDSTKISRRHCCLAQAYERVLIRDLGSRNGVRVNGKRIDEMQLLDGDEVAISHFLYRFELLLAAPPQSVARPSAMPNRPPAVIDLSSDDFIPIED
jgi:pSer/pThr/pTyr-binding forkhead associated (FHA) protein